MRSLRPLAQALLRFDQAQSRTPVQSSNSARAREYETVNPDGRLVSDRAAVRVWALDSPDAALPDDSILYIPRDYPSLRFRFTFVRCADGSYRAYIRVQPEYRHLQSDMSATHRLQDPHHGYFVCWQPAPRDAIAILKVARLWAERTARYVATGTRLEAP